MLSSVGLEVMNTTNPELNWNTVKRGRRTRKPVARSKTGFAKGGNSSSPEKIRDFSESDSDKLTEAALGQRTSSKSENVPIKKRRHLLQSPSSQPWTSFNRKDSSTPLKCDTSPPPDDGEQLKHSSFSSGDFSGIELLAAAASMDDDANDAKEDLVEEDTLMRKGWNIGLKCDKSEKPSSNLTMQGCNTDCSHGANNSASASRSLSGNPEDGTMSKVDRQHWDLNTPMDAWEEPYNDSIAGSTSNDVAVDVLQMKESGKGSEDYVLSNLGGSRGGSPSLIIERQKLTAVSLESSRKSASLEAHLQESQSNSCSDTARETSNQATRKDSDASNSNHILTGDARMETSVQVSKPEASIESCFIKLCCSSKRKRAMSEGKKDAISGILEEDCQIRGTECYQSTDSYRIQTKDQDAAVYDTPATEIYKPAIDIQQKGGQWIPEQLDGDSLKEIINSISCKRPDADKSESNSDETRCFYSASNSKFLAAATSGEDSNSALIADFKIQNNGTMIAHSPIADCQNYLEPVHCAPKLGDNVLLLPNEESKRITVEGLSNDGAGVTCDGPINAGKVLSAIDAQHNSNVSQDNHCHMVDGDALRFQEEYDSPYEDGELRGSFLFSWDDNEFENECVDYESDGRNGDGSVAADPRGSEVVEGGSEESHGTERRSLFQKTLLEGNKNKNGSSKYSLRRHTIKDDSENNEIGGKGESNAGSGTTVEQSIQMVMDENDDATKRRQQLADLGDTVDGKVAVMDEYVPEAVREKLQSRVQGQSSVDATYGKEFFLRQQCRSRRLGCSYSRSVRDISSDEYTCSRRPATHSQGDGVDQWTHWGSRRRHAPVYQEAESRSSARTRSNTRDSADKFGGSGFHDSRQTANYLSKGLHRPLMRRSPMDRDDSFVMRRRMPPRRGASSYRGREHCSPRDSRDFRGNFELLPDNVTASVRLSHFLSRRERSFSPSTGRTARIPFTRKRSQSRSRARSPRAYQSHRVRHLSTRRHSRSPDFRMERMRVPFSKYTFSSDYGEGYLSPSRSRFSPQHGGRWVDDPTFEDSSLRRQRSPVRVSRGAQKFDAVNSSRGFKSDEYLRPMNRPRRFSYVAGDNDRRHSDGGHMTHRGPHPDDGVNVRPFRRGAAGDDLETSNLINADDVRGTNRRDLPRIQGDREDKRAYKI